MLSPREVGLVFLALGAYFVFHGLTADYFVDETEGVASKEDKERWKATPLLRGLFVCLGIGIAIWGLLRYMGKSMHPVKRGY